MNKSTQRVVVYVLLAAAAYYGWRTYQARKATS